MDVIKISTVRNVLLLRGSKAFLGSLHITPHHLIFKFADDTEREIWVFFSTIHELAKKSPNAQLQTTLDISCRNFLFMRLLIQNEDEANAVYETMIKLAHTNVPNKLYAFIYYSSAKYKSDGWSVFDLVAEYKRMGIPNDLWRLTKLNIDYKLCSTYPRHIAVPTKISDAVLGYAAKFRSKGRLPALVYLHKSNGASITRCSQPLVGIKQNRSIQDEKLVEAIVSSSTNTMVDANNTAEDELNHTNEVFNNNGNISNTTMDNLLIDARPTANAMANTAKGAGTENMEHYKNCRKIYLGIDNIHVMRDSLAKLAEAIQQCDTDGTPLSTQILGKSGWLKHINMLLEGTAAVINTIKSGSHVLVHCSDGWDRTSQLVSLAKLCLDPYYRTIIGFETLLEMDWIAFGHKFSDRCGHISTDWSTITSTTAAGAALEKIQNRMYRQQELREVSPVFHQFLDCVYQLWTQYPTRFEFNEKFLIQLHFHAYSCQYGTFLFNSDSERQTHRVSTTTHSLWSYINTVMDTYLNSAYDATLDSSTAGGVLDCRGQYLRYWSGLFKQTEESDSNLIVAAEEAGGAPVVMSADTEATHGHSASTNSSNNSSGGNIVGKIGHLWNRLGLGGNIVTGNGNVSPSTGISIIGSIGSSGFSTIGQSAGSAQQIGNDIHSDGQAMQTLSKSSSSLLIRKADERTPLSDLFTPPSSFNPSNDHSTNPTSYHPDTSNPSSNTVSLSRPHSSAQQKQEPELLLERLLDPTVILPPSLSADNSPTKQDDKDQPIDENKSMAHPLQDPLGMGGSVSVLKSSQRGVLTNKSS